MIYRPLRPFFYKPVAILGVPLFYWKLSLVVTVFLAVILFFIWRSVAGIPIWFVASLAVGLGMSTFFLWAHNTHKRGWLEFAVSYYWREISGQGQSLLPARAGRTRTKWLLNVDATFDNTEKFSKLFKH